MLIALSCTCIQTFSVRLASHADVLRGSSRVPDEPLRTCEASVRHVPTWSAIRHVACRAPDDPFWAGMTEVLLLPLPNKITFWIRQFNKYILPFITKGYHIPPFSQWGFCTPLQIWHELNVAWWTEQRFVCLFGLFFCKLRGRRFSLLINLLTVLRAIHKKTREGLQQSGLQDTKKYGAGKYSRAHAPLARKYTNRTF